jgi:hypothetical protein
MRPLESPNRSQRGSCPAVGTTRQKPASCTLHPKTANPTPEVGQAGCSAPA